MESKNMSKAKVLFIDDDVMLGNIVTSINK